MLGKALILTGILVGSICLAQAPAGAPAGSTAQCSDGTYYSGATKSGACRGHKGVKTWWGAAGASSSVKSSAKTTTATGAKGGSSPAASSTPTPAPAPPPVKPPASSAAPTSSSAKTPLSAKTAAAGGGPGLVWLNTSSNVYHCYGTQYYGKTKAGAYMTEADAKAKGAHSEGGKPCSK